MTLICSSCCSDSVTVSRDVTLPQHPKRLLWTLILSCLILCQISYDKQMRVVVKGRVADRSAVGSTCVAWNWLFVCFGLKTGLRVWASSVFFTIALSLHWIWFIGCELFHSLPFHLCLLESKEKRWKKNPSQTLQMSLNCCEPLSFDGAHHHYHEKPGTNWKSGYVILSWIWLKVTSKINVSIASQ